MEAKRSKLILNCESSEAPRTRSIVKKLISKRSEHFNIKDLNIEVKRSKLISNGEFSEAKRMYFKKSYQRSVANTVFKKITLAKRSERSYLKKLHKRSKNKLGFTKTRQYRSEAFWFILKFDKIEAKLTGSIVSEKNEPSLFLKTKAKKL
jgi:hypothetical protein